MFFKLSQNPEMAAEAAVPISRSSLVNMDKLLNAARRQMHSWSGTSFDRASNDLCSPASFEEGSAPAAEILDDIAIGVPNAFNPMAIMMKDAGLDEVEERRG